MEKIRVEIPTKTQVCEDLSLSLETSSKYAVQEFHLCTVGKNVFLYFCGYFGCFLKLYKPDSRILASAKTAFSQYMRKNESMEAFL